MYFIQPNIALFVGYLGDQWGMVPIQSWGVNGSTAAPALPKNSVDADDETSAAEEAADGDCFIPNN